MSVPERLTRLFSGTHGNDLGTMSFQDRLERGAGFRIIFDEDDVTPVEQRRHSCLGANLTMET